MLVCADSALTVHTAYPFAAVQCLNSTFQLLIGLCQTTTWAHSIASSPLGMAIILRTALTPMEVPARRSFPQPNPSSGEPSSDPVVVPGSDDPHPDAQTVKLDMMCYALALLTNILQHDPSAAELIGSACERV